MKKLLLTAVAACALLAGTAMAAELPAPKADEAKTKGSESIVLAGGCFWGMESVFQHVKGVTQVTSGYAGGGADTATYNHVSDGDTGHAESVQVTYDPSQVSLGQLLQVYFGAAHDPTQLNRQGPDSGTQYRSAIFYSSPEQQKLAADYMAQLNEAHSFSKPIVTQMTPLKGFYPAEDYHQNYAEQHPHNPYIVINDAPKVAMLEKQYPQLYTSTAAP